MFGSALCLGTLVLRDPTNALASLALSQLDAAIAVFTSLIRHGANTPRYHRNLRWLVKLRDRASSKMSTATTVQTDNERRAADPAEPRSSDDREDGDDIELLGWRTRLIERAGKNSHTIRTINVAATPTSSNMGQRTPDQSRHDGAHGQPSLGEMTMPGGPLRSAASTDPTDELVR